MNLSTCTDLVLSARRALATQNADLAMMKQALVQDAAALQLVSASSQPSAPIVPSHSGLGNSLNIMV